MPARISVIKPIFSVKRKINHLKINLALNLYLNTSANSLKVTFFSEIHHAKDPSAHFFHTNQRSPVHISSLLSRQELAVASGFPHFHSVCQLLQASEKNDSLNVFQREMYFNVFQSSQCCQRELASAIITAVKPFAQKFKTSKIL